MPSRIAAIVSASFWRPASSEPRRQKLAPNRRSIPCSAEEFGHP